MADTSDQHGQADALQRNYAANYFDLLGFPCPVSSDKERNCSALFSADEIDDIEQFHAVGALAINLQDDVTGANSSFLGGCVRYRGDDGKQPVANTHLCTYAFKKPLNILPHHRILLGIQVRRVRIIDGIHHPPNGAVCCGSRIKGGCVDVLPLKEVPDFCQLGEFWG